MAGIDRKLNLVIPVDNSDGSVTYVHSTPISREVFERYFKIIARTFAEIYSGGYTVYAGPRVAALLLKSTAMDLGVWDGPTGVERGLMAEIRRLTNVVLPAPQGGWVTMPFVEAIKAGQINDDDVAEVDNALAFFTVACAMHKKSDLMGILSGASKLWGGSTTSFNCTEFAASLTTSTEVGNTGETQTTSSLPS